MEPMDDEELRRKRKRAPPDEPDAEADEEAHDADEADEGSGGEPHPTPPRDENYDRKATEDEKSSEGKDENPQY